MSRNDVIDEMENQSKVQNYKLDAEYSTKYSKYQYQLEKNQTGNFYLSWLYVIYIICSTLFVYFLIFGSKRKEISILNKVGYVVLIIFFPFVSVPLELYLKDSIIYFHNIFFGKAYKKTKWEIYGETNMNSKYGIKK